MLEPTAIQHILQFLGDSFGQGLKLIALRDAQGAEIARKEITDKLIDGDTLITDVVFTEPEAVGTISSAMLYAGEAASTSIPDSGIPFAEMLPDQPIDKTNEDEITLSFEVRVVT